jgi:O-antigen/teichoic acid export membrane protein
MIGAVVTALVTRYLGPQQAGILSYAIALVALAQPLVTLDSTVVNALVQTPGQRAAILGTAAGLKLGASVSAYVLLVLAIGVLQPGAPSTQLVCLIVGCQLIFQVGEVADYDLQSRLQGFRIVRARICAALIASATRLTMIVASTPLAVLAAVIPLEALLTSMFLLMGSDRDRRDLSTWRFNRDLARTLSNETWPLVVSGLMLAASAHADKLLLGQLRGPGDVGIYFAAYQLSALWYFLASIVSTAAGPDLARYYATDTAQYHALQQRLYNALTAAGIVVAAVTTAFAEEIVSLVFGAAFQASADVLKIHIWTGIFLFHMHLRTRIFVIERKQSFTLTFSLLTLVTNLALNAVCIRRYGTEGAAYASVLSWAMCAGIFPLLSSRTRAAARMFASSFNPLLWWRLAAK